MDLNNCEARRHLRAAHDAEQRMTRVDVRPYGRSLTLVALLQTLAFAVLGLTMAFWWNWIGVILAGCFAVAATTLGQRRLERASKVVPSALGASERRVGRWQAVSYVALPIIAGAVAASAIDTGGIHPAGLLVAVAGAVAAAPRLILGIQLWRQ